jgi:uncharacterized membrane protein YfcA
MGPLLLLFLAGLLGGGMNALAGGGSFVTLPALIAAGVAPVQANASSTVALYPGGLAGAWTYRHDRTGTVCAVPVPHLLGVTLAGGLAGALLLIFTPGGAFDVILPWLLLLATAALAFGRRIGAILQRHHRAPVPVVLLIQAILGVYGGYFGGAVGLMMLAAWTVLGERDLKALNGPRIFLVVAANTMAVVCFVIAFMVRWPQTLAMLLGATLGGYAGARISRLLPPRLVRVATLCFTAAMTAAFFARTYLAGG